MNYKSLSTRALQFLISQNRTSNLHTRNSLIEVFKRHGIEPFESLIEFELKYGGYTLYAGLAPIQFQLISGGGSHFDPTLATLDYEESDDPEDDYQYQFFCANTNYQVQFSLDEKGRYYEDYELKYSCFDKLIENLAIWKASNELSFNEIFRNKTLKTHFVPEDFGLTILEETVDIQSQWFKAENLFLRKEKDSFTLLGKKDDPLVNELLSSFNT